LHYLTSGGKDIQLAQILFGGLYIISLQTFWLLQIRPNIPSKTRASPGLELELGLDGGDEWLQRDAA
jgi:hypothetical protein